MVFSAYCQMKVTSSGNLAEWRRQGQSLERECKRVEGS